jgi:hypothetical protein
MILDRRLPSAVTSGPRSSELAEESGYELPVLRLSRTRVRGMTSTAARQRERRAARWRRSAGAYRAGRDGPTHSARSAAATDVRAASQPGTMAVRIARASADMAATVTVTIEVVGWGTT